MIKFKSILSGIAAVVISIFAISLFIKIIGATLQVMFNLAFIILILIISLPIYVIIKKKLFK